MCKIKIMISHLHIRIEALQERLLKGSAMTALTDA